MRPDRRVIFGASRPSDPMGLRVFRSRGDAGNGELRRLLAAIAAGGVNLAIIDTRRNGHSGVRAVVIACRRHRVQYLYR